jgi:GDP-4-dehydro-6-deoxy-D-mannose reductase
VPAAWITGCAGFAGEHLAAELSRRGWRLWGIDRVERRTKTAVGIEDLDLDLKNSGAVQHALQRTRPDAVFHLASQSSGGLSFQRPVETIHNNLDVMLGLLEALRALADDGAVPPRLLAVGSCEEYGAPVADSDLPLAETQPLRPANPYAVSKAAQTLLGQQYRRAHGIPVLCVRSFTHTGPGQSDRFVFSSFARQIAEIERGHREGTLHVGNLDVSRDVSDVRDVVRAYADLMELEEGAWSSEAVNVCSGRELHIRDGLEILLRKSRVAVHIEQDPARLRPADVPRFVGDPTRLRSLIGWIPTTPLEQTLEDLLNWWREKLPALDASDPSP